MTGLRDHTTLFVLGIAMIHEVGIPKDYFVDCPNSFWQLRFPFEGDQSFAHIGDSIKFGLTSQGINQLERSRGEHRGCCGYWPIRDGHALVMRDDDSYHQPHLLPSVDNIWYTWQHRQWIEMCYQQGRGYNSILWKHHGRNHTVKDRGYGQEMGR